MTAHKAGMSLEIFEDHLDRFGGTVGSWPERIRQHAETLLSTSEEARELLAEVNTMETYITRAAPLRAPAGLADRIANRAFQQRQQNELHPTHPAYGLAEQISESFSSANSTSADTATTGSKTDIIA
ncbi:hypothetical protein [Roseibium suaedae]|uniref:Uncharacterized protein n=1 Tax=Roseibium suaedae TaxID=735517 RepID=A0A1M7IAW4_9HYPH|nr:hypothetical protein [Roseibium suaedae]SHM37825.1 hypothetical protein SAMN05444272_2484 [Roseibium suaedae]